MRVYRKTECSHLGEPYRVLQFEAERRPAGALAARREVRALPRPQGHVLAFGFARGAQRVMISLKEGR